MSRKKIKQGAQVVAEKKPKTRVDSDGYLARSPVWAFARCDKERWSLINDEYCSSVIAKLADYEGMTWQNIQSSSGGKRRGTNNHFINIANLCVDAQKRACEMKIDEVTDQLFSLRLSGKERLFGILTLGVFYAVWYDKDHEICPVSK